MKTLLATLLLALPSVAQAAAATGDLKSDSWVATDALGRQTLPHADTPPRAGKTVGMFYFLWMGEHGTNGPYDITKLLAADPEEPKYGPRHAYHLWGEPEAGYFLSKDPWVARRNMSMLADAGVDTLIFDVTNAVTYRNNYLLVCKTLAEMRANGQRTPQVMFITWSASPDTVKRIYDEFYRQNLYPELWFRWQGKPLILGKPDEKMRDGSSLPQPIRDFFTWRQAWFQPAGYEAGYHKWTWGSTSPQDFAWDKEGVPEQVSVSLATHPTGNNGRSHHNGRQPQVDRYRMAKETPFGLFFSEQWERALQIDPAFTFVTGWNEWQAMRFITGTPGVSDSERDAPVAVMAGSPAKPGDSYFVDLYNQEFSRDIDPMKGGHTDNYYYQLVNYVRRTKGARKPEPPGPPKAIRLSGPFSQWDSVTPEYRDTIGDTAHRDHAGWGTHRYLNRTGRNDIVRAKVARDAKHVTFYVETKGNLTPRAGKSWMLLFLDSDQNPHTGWHGYDYVLNRGGVGARTATLERNAGGGWKWMKVADVPWRAVGNRLMLQVPRSAIGQAGRDVALDFHWADNIAGRGDIAEFFTEGDSAPNRRFNYRYSAHTPGPVWSFTVDGFHNGWTDVLEVTDLRVEKGALAGTLLMPGGHVSSGDMPSIDASSNPYIVIRMKVSDGKRAAFSWGTASNPRRTADRFVQFPIKADGRFHDYVVDLRTESEWKGWVNNLRVHPSDYLAKFEISRIWVRPTAGP